MALAATRRLGRPGQIPPARGDEERRRGRGPGEELQMRPLLRVLPHGPVARGFEHLGGTEQRRPVVRPAAHEDELGRVPPFFRQGGRLPVTGVDGPLGSVRQRQDLAPHGGGGAPVEVTPDLADADRRQEQAELVRKVGSDPRDVHARRIGKRGRGRQDDQLGGLGHAAAGRGGEGQRPGARLPGQPKRLGRARDLPRDRDSDHQVRARAGRREVAGRVTGELERAHGLGRPTGQRFERQLRGERGMMRVAAAGDVQALDGQAELVVERLPHGVVEDGDQLADERRQAADLGDHGVHRGRAFRAAGLGVTLTRDRPSPARAPCAGAARQTRRASGTASGPAPAHRLTR